MTRIVIDAELRKKLLDLKEPLELTDEEGKLLGQFTPAFDPSEWEPLEPQISEEELQRRENSNERRYTTAEVLSFLQARSF